MECKIRKFMESCDCIECQYRRVARGAIEKYNADRFQTDKEYLINKEYIKNG